MIRICSIRFPHHLLQIAQNQAVFEGEAFQNSSDVRAGFLRDG